MADDSAVDLRAEVDGAEVAGREAAAPLLAPRFGGGRAGPQRRHPPLEVVQRAALSTGCRQAERQWWYKYYFATERGRAGYKRYRREFAKLIWRTTSPLCVDHAHSALDHFLVTAHPDVPA